LADKIENVGNDYSAQLDVQSNIMANISADARAHEAPFAKMRMEEVRKYELERYARLYQSEALAVRAAMLERIPDIPVYDLSTVGTVSLYEAPTNGLGFVAVAKNLRALANTYEIKMRANVK
jgi:hypothetical protein